ncbi:MAG: SGNH/GDSL hydrolase family protein [Pseudomonadota bacterium]
MTGLIRFAAFLLGPTALLLLVIVFARAFEVKPDGRQILYIGNSLTSSNSLPETVFEMAKARGHTLLYFEHTPGGTRLSEHASSRTLSRAIEAGAWEKVVIQGQSQYSAFHDWQLERDVFPYATDIIEQIRELHPDAQIVLYQTMAHRDGDQENKDVIPEVGTYTGMQTRINSAYERLASLNSAELAPVGVAWMSFRRDFPDVELYTDDRHPNPLGSYLAACVVFTALFDMPCSGTPIPSDVNAELAGAAQKIADRTASEHSLP